MFGQINKITSLADKRDLLVELVRTDANTMPGCRSYMVALDSTDDTVIWVTEVWDNAEMQKASMSIPSVKASVEKAMPMIAGFETVATIIPIA
ncbi:putative quinol monooxygenase [Albidovulum sp.]|uniref:putative quinol monooxygenase n=1 Tax=Albidovulum sp. TaxID=1872424 RepID=UPI0039B919A9